MSQPKTWRKAAKGEGRALVCTHPMSLCLETPTLLPSTYWTRPRLWGGQAACCKAHLPKGSRIQGAKD